MPIPPSLRALFLVLLLAGPSGQALAQAPIQLADAVRDYAIRSGGDPRTQEFRYALRDLNGDGQEEALVLLLTRDACDSGGCTLLVLRGRPGPRYDFLSATTVVRGPVRVSTRDQRHGWASLIVHARGDGEVLLRFDGLRYPPDASCEPVANRRQVKASELLIR